MSIVRVVATSDTHNNYPDIPPCDIFIHAGDLTSRGTREELDAAFGWISKVPAEYKVVIAGNHDFELQKGYKTKYDIVYLEDSLVELKGLKIYGSPWTPMFHNWAFMHSRDKMYKVWENVPSGLDILVTHGPPAGIMDRTGTDHAGCSALTNLVMYKPPIIHIFGHIHEGYGRVIGPNTTFANVSFVGLGADMKARPANPPQVFDILI